MLSYVNDVPTRKVDRLVGQLGILGMSNDRVWALCREFDERVDAFRSRPLEGAFLYPWLDAKHLKVRNGGSVRYKHWLSPTLCTRQAVGTWPVRACSSSVEQAR
jgi:transposase-like protein